jgi:peptidoglycan/xylan/chitin deacetylase (PgdA/CDA1 family)
VSSARCDLVDLKIPIRLQRPVRLSSSRVVAEGFVSPTFTRPDLAERFLETTGLQPDAFRLPTRVFEFDACESDEIIVRDGKGGRPLIVRRDGELLVAFDVHATQAFQFTDSKRPIYTYIPWFNIQKVPEQLRRPISNAVQAMRSNSNRDPLPSYRTLPLTNFELALMLLSVSAGAGRDPAAPLFQWPEGKRAAFISLHDVDTDRFLRMKDRSPLLRLEQKHGIRSTWFVPTARLRRNPRALDFLLASGHEVGWHGHNHDHRDHVGRFAEIAADALRQSWLNSQTAYPTGMRAPKLLKSHHLFATLERSCQLLRYDTSFLNGIVPYQLWLYGRPSRILEIPTTVPTDIRVYNELSSVSRSKRPGLMVEGQLARTNKLLNVGGLISIVTHPEKSLSERADFLEVYDEYLSTIRKNPDIWFTTAGELCRYWTAGEAAVGNAPGVEPFAPAEVRAS